MDGLYKHPVLAVVGPTATGKTALGVALAKRFGGEVISADSMQIYRGLDVGTAKVTAEETQGVPHHCVDFLPPEEVFSVADFTALAARLEQEISARGALPILVGGTGLYIQSFLEGRGQLKIGRVQPTYNRGVTAADLGSLLPEELAQTLRAGLRAYERKIAGYTAPEAILTGLETRTSSPVRLGRGESMECTQLAGLYPCGEGAGYAGGIMSAAVDGLRVAGAVCGRYCPTEG